MKLNHIISAPVTNSSSIIFSSYNDEITTDLVCLLNSHCKKDGVTFSFYPSYEFCSFMEDLLPQPYSDMASYLRAVGQGNKVDRFVGDLLASESLLPPVNSAGIFQGDFYWYLVAHKDGLPYANVEEYLQEKLGLSASKYEYIDINVRDYLLFSSADYTKTEYTELIAEAFKATFTSSLGKGSIVDLQKMKEAVYRI